MAESAGCTRLAASEDFCQALGFISRTKYEADGGPSFARCFRLVRDVSERFEAPLDDLVEIAALRRDLSCVLAGNSRDGLARG